MFLKDILNEFGMDLGILSYYFKKVHPKHPSLSNAVAKSQFIIIIILFDEECESSFSSITNIY